MHLFAWLRLILVCLTFCNFAENYYGMFRYGIQYVHVKNVKCFFQGSNFKCIDLLAWLYYILVAWIFSLVFAQKADRKQERLSLLLHLLYFDAASLKIERLATLDVHALYLGEAMMLCWHLWWTVLATVDETLICIIYRFAWTHWRSDAVNVLAACRWS